MKATKKFLSKLRSRIWENGMRQCEVAQAAQLSDAKFSRFLHGYVDLTLEEIHRVEKALEKK